MCNFKIGQEVVAVKNHTQGDFKQGQHLFIEGIKKAICKCNVPLVDVGIRHKNAFISYCPCCNNERRVTNGVVWYKHTNFAPLQTDSEEADMNEALKEVFQRELFETT